MRLLRPKSLPTCPGYGTKKNSINYLSSACWRGRFAIGKTSQGWGNWSSTSWEKKWVTLALGCFWFGSKTSHNKKLRKIAPQLVPTEFSPDGETEKDVFFDGETHPNKTPNKCWARCFARFPLALNVSSLMISTSFLFCLRSKTQETSGFKENQYKW